MQLFFSGNVILHLQYCVESSGKVREKDHSLPIHLEEESTNDQDVDFGFCRTRYRPAG